jgi:isopentenyl diphosphate isomerase/L-lactate dehydrogenase-like FMN-dependent dehydrogenase
LLLSNNPKAGKAFQVSDISQFKKIGNSLKVIVKGIMSKEDALLCLSHGSDAIWISNGEGAK